MSDNKQFPLNFSSSFNYCLSLFKFSIKDYLKIFLVFQLPSSVLIILLTNLTSVFSVKPGVSLSNLPFTMSQNSYNFSDIITLIPVIILITIIILLLSVIFRGMVCDLYLKTYSNNVWTFKSSLNYIKNRFGSILGGFFLVILMTIGGILCFCIGIIPVMVFTLFIFPVILFENTKAFDSISRSINLIKKDFWRILSILLVYIIIAFGIYASYTLIIQFVASSFYQAKGEALNSLIMSGPISFQLIYLSLNVLCSFIISGFASALEVVLYFNQKVLREDYGVQKEHVAAEQTSHENIELEDKKEDDNGNQ